MSSLLLALLLPPLAVASERPCPECKHGMARVEGEAPGAAHYLCRFCEAAVHVRPDGREAVSLRVEGERRVFEVRGGARIAFALPGIDSDNPEPVPPRPVNLPGHPVGLPDHPVELPGHPVRPPDHPVELPGHPVELPDHPVELPGHPVDLSAHPVELPGHAVTLPGHPAPLPSHPVRLSSHPVRLAGHPVGLPGHPTGGRTLVARRTPVAPAPVAAPAARAPGTRFLALRR